MVLWMRAKAIKHEHDIVVNVESREEALELYEEWKKDHPGEQVSAFILSPDFRDEEL